MSKAKGFARPSQYEVKIDLPPILHRVQANFGQQLTLHCNSVSMPGHDLQSQKVQFGSEPAVDMVTSHAYADTINASFYLGIWLVYAVYYNRMAGVFTYKKPTLAWNNRAYGNYTRI